MVIIIMLSKNQGLAKWLLIISLIGLSYELTRVGTGDLFRFSTYITPGFQCSAFCMYDVNTDYSLIPRCTSHYTAGTATCSKCDLLLFRKVGSECVFHLYNSESLLTPPGGQYRIDLQVGFIDNSLGWSNSATQLYSGIPAHFALRVRFSIYLYNWDDPLYIYPLRYSIDEKGYTYNQTLDKYWSPYDIITSSLQSHTDSQATISFRSLDDSSPINTCDNNRNKDCYGCCFSCCGTSCCSWSCCDKRYIRINELLVFASLCQTGCLSCLSATFCMICSGPGYYLYKADHMCYSTCPQTTYKDASNLFSSTLTQYWCSDCPAKCLECTTATFCTKCFAYGRNQSFLFNNTCINPCVRGYTGNYTTHICNCPLDYFFQDVVNLLCTACALECVRCFNSTNLDCTYCQMGYYLAYSTTHCLIQCPVGQYKNDWTRQCSLCDPTCSDCEQKSTLCTECYFTNPMKYLLGRQCLTWCPPGYQWNNITHRCDICTLFTYSLYGKCVSFCPSMHLAQRQNRSCIHLSKTDYTFTLKLVSVNILNHGKLMKFEILAQDGLNATSYQAVIKRSYFNAQVLYKDQMVKNTNGVTRSLYTMNMPIRNIQYQNNRIIFVTQIPSNLDYRKSFQIVFLETIAGNQNIVYGNVTNTYNVGQHPQLMKSYYIFFGKNLCQIIMIPFVIIVLLFFTLQIKGVYELYMELLRTVQLLGLLVYSSFPVGKYIFYFLVGCSYANLDFIPNLYAWAAKPESVNNLTSYFMTAEDMDFIRLNGSVLFFGILWGAIILISKYLIKAKESRVRYMINFGIDLMEVKILHSFQSALIFVVINYNMTNFSIFATFLFALLLFSAINGRRYSIWRETKDVSPLYLWRVVGTLLFCFVSLANELLITLIFCTSLIATMVQFYLLHSNKYLIDINNLNSQNYMSQKTYKILNNYDQQIKFCWSISIRNTVITIFPIMTSLFASILILLKESEIESIIFTSALLYAFLIIVIINSVLIYNFLEERRKYLAQNKLEYLQKRFSKLSGSQTMIHQERKRPRAYNGTIEDEKYLDQNPARSMMKNID